MQAFCVGDDSKLQAKDASTSVVSNEQLQGQSVAGERMILVTGAPGAEEYEAEFEGWAQSWIEMAERQGWELTHIQAANQAGETNDRELLRQAIESHQESDQRLWIVMLGHGTFSRNVAKFNLEGPDVSAVELQGWLNKIERPCVVINCSSASSPFLPLLSTTDRLVITATRSGNEINFSRFGKYLAASINDLEADIDHDREVSLLEAFLAATAKTERFYREDARLVTEHALLDDNGDRAGISADFYQGSRPSKEAKQGATIDGRAASRIIVFSSPDVPQFDGELAAQRTQIEQEIDTLRSAKATLPADEYYAQLESLLLKLASLYDAAEASNLQKSSL
jgi:hypothetical protein